MNSAVIDELRHQANKKLDPKKKGALGQFMTPSRIATFMAGLFSNRSNAVLLDAGAGIGSLTLATKGILELERVEAWEVDQVMISYLQSNLESLNVPFELHATDFILDSVDRIQFKKGTRFTHAILNPPYKKINTNSEHRIACRNIGLETVNLYTAFLGIAILQMKAMGEVVIIIPRSFCNGPYYKPFRELMLHHCSIDVIHVFESRSKAFKDDEVLQENIILKITKGKPQGEVLLSFSHDSNFADLTQRKVSFEEIVKSDDAEKFIRIPTDEAQENGNLFLHSIKELGLQICTGPVVDFRMKEHWDMEGKAGTVPLFYSHHFTKDGFIHPYPKEHKKPNGLVRSPEVDKWLMKEGVYVLVKRFSAKEERRRVVAHLITPDDTKSESKLVGFENHWNVFHINKMGLDLDIAKGLTLFLNSTALDSYFRIFSGHTQVNATDLRNMLYPSIAQLRKLGRNYKNGLSQEEIDSLMGAI